MKPVLAPIDEEYDRAADLCAMVEGHNNPNIPNEAKYHPRKYIFKLIHSKLKGNSNNPDLWELASLLPKIANWERWKHVEPKKYDKNYVYQYANVPLVFAVFDAAIRGSDVWLMSANDFFDLLLERRIQYHANPPKKIKIERIVIPIKEERNLKNKKSVIIRVARKRDSKKGTSDLAFYSDKTITATLKKNSEIAQLLTQIRKTYRGFNIGVISRKKHKKKAETKLDTNLSLHYYNLRSKNDLQDCEILVILGTPNVNVETLKETYLDFKSIKDSELDQIINNSKINKEGRRIYNDNLMQAISDAYNDEELYQAIHRSRFTRNNRLVILISRLPERIKNQATIVYEKDFAKFLKIEERIRTKEFYRNYQSGKVKIDWKQLYKRKKNFVGWDDATELNQEDLVYRMLWILPVSRTNTRKIIKADKGLQMVKGRGRSHNYEIGV